MLHRFLSSLILLSILSLLVYTVLLSHAAEPSRASQDPVVVNKTTGCEMKAEIVGGQVAITLKNNHPTTLTAFAIGFDRDFRITADFAYSDVHSGIPPGTNFQKTYPLPGKAPLSSVHLLTVVLENGQEDGNPLVAQEIRDERLGQKIQILRTLRILEKQDFPKDFKTLSDDILAALNSEEAETLVILRELQPTHTLSSRRNNDKLPVHLREGLQIGREKMLRKLEELQRAPSESFEEALLDWKMRSRNLLAKL